MKQMISLSGQPHVAAVDAHFGKEDGLARTGSKGRNVGSTRNSKTMVTDAQKRIAKIIRDQGGGPQMDSLGVNPERPPNGIPKSRNAAISQSKSDNVLGGQQTDTFGSLRRDHSPSASKPKKEPYATAAGYSQIQNQKYSTDTNEKSTTSSRSGGGVNKLRTSSGMRNKPQGVSQ